MDTATIVKIFWLFACHFLGDFAFQTTYLTEGKRKSWEANFYHAATYLATLVVFGLGPIVAVSVFLTAMTTFTVTTAPVVNAAWAAGIILVTHFFIDPLKSGPIHKKNGEPFINRIWVDQLLHLTVLVVIVWTGLV